MLELRCPGCGRANAVVGAELLAAARCAECEAALDAGRTVHYLVAEGGYARGPQDISDLARAAAAGTLTPDVLLSEEHGPWFRAGEREDLFPRARPQRHGVVHRAVTRTRGARIAQPPGSVVAMIALELLVGVLVLLTTFVVFALLVSYGGLLQGLVPLLLLAGLGAGHLRLARGLRARSIAARNLQLLLAGLGGVGVLLLASADAPAAAVLVAGILVAIPFLLLMEADARRWFEDRDAGRSG